MNRVVSVIIPVYNVEEYLPKCLESVINQSYKNLEIILVDDGSIDKTGKICDDYAKRDKRVIVIHKENGGVSAARNDGIKIANGEYVCFVDGDDWIESDYFEIAMKHIIDIQPDCLINNFVKDVDGIFKKVFSSQIKVVKMDAETALLEMFKQDNYGWEPVASFYRTKVIKNIKFNPSIHFGEDLLFKYDFLKACKGYIIYSSLEKYHYVFRMGSAVNSYSVLKKMDDLKVAKAIIKKESNSSIKQFVFAKCYVPLLINKCRLAAISSIDEDKQIYIEIKKEIKSLCTCLIFNRDVSIFVKIKMLVCLFPREFIRAADELFRFLKLI